MLILQAQPCGVGQRRSLVALGCQIGQNRPLLGLAQVAGLVQVMTAGAASCSERISRFDSEAIVQASD